MSIEDPFYEATIAQAKVADLIELTVKTTLDRVVAETAASQFLNSKDCAAMLGITPEYLCAMRARNEGPAWSGHGKWVRYERNNVVRWLRDLPRRSHQSSAQMFERSKP
jgi:hypothetical protein